MIITLFLPFSHLKYLFLHLRSHYRCELKAAKKKPTIFYFKHWKRTVVLMKSSKAWWFRSGCYEIATPASTSCSPKLSFPPRKAHVIRCALEQQPCWHVWAWTAWKRSWLTTLSYRPLSAFHWTTACWFWWIIMLLKLQ